MNDIVVADQPQTAMVPRPANPLDMSPVEFRAALDRRGSNRRALIEWVRSALVDGTDYGVIQTRKGPSKPSLRKPGAEKICGMLGVTPTFPTLKDYESAALEGKDIRSIILRCHLVSADGQIVADGVGARSVEQDYGDLNKALKMAVKSAQIDATLRMAGLSEIFTQDIEDMPQGRVGEPEGGSTSERTQQSCPPDNAVPSGKHRGKPWSEISEDYLSWATSSEKAPAPLREGAQKELLRRDAKRTAA